MASSKDMHQLDSSQVDWHSSNAHIATVDSDGLVTALAPGQVEILNAPALCDETHFRSPSTNLDKSESRGPTHEISSRRACFRLLPGLPGRQGLNRFAVGDA